MQVFSCEICKVFKNTFIFTEHHIRYFWYDSETYDMLKLYLSLDFNFFSVFQVNLVKMNHLICYVKKTSKIKRLIQYVKSRLFICLLSNNMN